MTTYTVGSAAELQNALSNVSGGDTILLVAGEYGRLKIEGVNYNSMVTIKSYDASNKTELDRIEIIDSSNIKFDSVHVNFPGNFSRNNPAGVVDIDEGSHHIELVNSEVNAKIDDDYEGGRGIFVGDASHINIENNYIHDVRHGGVFLGGDNIVVSENTFNHLLTDSMKFAGVRNVLIENNIGARNINPREGSHKDFVQFQGSSQDIIIRGNLYLPAEEVASQGIFMDDGVYKNVLIENNIIYNGNLRGISVTEGSGITAKNNTVLTFPDFGASASVISLPNGSISQNNIIGFYKGELDANLKIQPNKGPDEPYYYNDIYVNAMKGAGITLDDLRPVEGSLGESYGAYARIYELLNEQGSGSSAPPADSGDADSGDADSGDADSGDSDSGDSDSGDSDSGDSDSGDSDSGDAGTGDASVNIPAPVLNEGSHTFSGNPAQAVVLPHNAAYELAAGTVELSFEADTLSGLQGLLSKDASYFGTGGHLGVFLDGNDIRIRMQSANDQTDFKIADVVKGGQSHHLALTFGAAGLKVYLDGAEVAADSWTGGLQGNLEPMVIGANQWASSATTANKLIHGFDGTVSKVNLYAEVLSAEDVAALATGGGVPVNPNDAPEAVDPNDAPEAVDPNDAPEAVTDSLSLDEDTSATVDVLANDSDQDGDALSVQSFTQGANGSVTVNANGTLNYSPNADFNGQDSFTYIVSDGNGGTDTARVDVTVNPLGDPPATGDIVVSDASELLAALGTATGGETVLLESNNYGDIDLTNFQFSDYVTLESAEGQGAVFHTLDIESSRFLRLDSVHVANSTDGVKGKGFVNILNSNNIQLVNSEIHGSIDNSYVTLPDGSPSAYGLRVKDSNNITVSSNSIHDAEKGAVFFGVTNLTVNNNIVNNTSNDSFVFAGITNSLIENNTGATKVHPDQGAHIDFIQFQGDGTDIVLRGNVLLPEKYPNDKVYQGIFLKDGEFNDVSIEDNLIYTNTVNGIYLESNSGTGGNITIRDNTVLTPPDATKWGNADIRIVELQGPYIIEDNIVDRIVDQVNNGKGNTSGNIQLQWENPNGGNYYNDFYVNATEGTGATIEDFVPVPGSLAEDLGAHERILELLGSNESGSGDTNNTPVAKDDVFATNEDVTLNGDVLADNGNAVDSDPDGDVLTVNTTPVSSPANGALTLNADGTFSYTPNADFNGNDSFSYAVSDGKGGTDTATVVMTVNAVGDEPNAGGDEPNVGDIPSPLLSVGSNDFNGSLGDAIVVPHDASYELTSGTFEVEFSTDELVSRQGLLTKDAKYNGDGGHFLAFLEEDDIYVRMQNSSTLTEVRVKDVIEQDQDHHLAITFGPGGLKLYLDGTEVASNGWTGGLQGNAEPVVVGANQWASSPETADKIQDPFHGTIREVNLYGEILSEQDIADLANDDAVL